MIESSSTGADHGTQWDRGYGEVTGGEQLLSMSRSRSLPHSLVCRAKIVLMDAGGYTTKEIAMQGEVTPTAITHWENPFVAQGFCGST